MAPINDIIGSPPVAIAEDDPLNGIFALTLAAKSTLHLTRSTRAAITTEAPGPAPPERRGPQFATATVQPPRRRKRPRLLRWSSEPLATPGVRGGRGRRPGPHPSCGGVPRSRAPARTADETGA